MKQKALLLVLFISPLFLISQPQPCSNLFISEYIEGTYQNKAIEIYNPTNSPIDLSNYQLERYRDGALDNTSGGITVLSGVLNSGKVWVVTNGDTDPLGSNGYIDSVLYNLGNQAAGVYPTPLHMNGNDAIVLSRISPYEKLDIIGKIGENPPGGVGWTDLVSSAVWTQNHTLIRKPTIQTGVMDNPILFDPSLEWDSFPTNTWDGLGSHTCDCISTSIEDNYTGQFLVYPNPVLKGSYFILNSINNIYLVEIYNVLGKKEKQLIVNEKTAKVYTSKMNEGIYFVRAVFKNGDVVDKKLIIE